MDIACINLTIYVVVCSWLVLSFICQLLAQNACLVTDVLMCCFFPAICRLWWKGYKLGLTFKIGMVLKSISKTRLEDRVQGIWCKVRSLTWRLIRMAWHDVRLRLETWRVIGIRIGSNCCVKFHVYNGICWKL